MGNIERRKPPVLPLSVQMRVAADMAAPEIRGFAAMIKRTWLPEAERLEGAVEALEEASVVLDCLATDEETTSPGIVRVAQVVQDALARAEGR